MVVVVVVVVVVFLVLLCVPVRQFSQDIVTETFCSANKLDTEDDSMRQRRISFEDYTVWRLEASKP